MVGVVPVALCGPAAAGAFVARHQLDRPATQSAADAYRAAAAAVCTSADVRLASRPRPNAGDGRGLARFLANGLRVAETDYVPRLERLAPPPELRDRVAAALALVRQELAATRSEVALLRAGADAKAVLARSSVRALSLREAQAWLRVGVPACANAPARAGNRGDTI
jgi:hypothetical protein